MSLFNDLNYINVNEHTKKQNGLTYLSWTWAWAEIKKVDPKATAFIHEFPMLDNDFRPIAEGVTVPYLKTPEGYFVKVSVTINGHIETEMLPVMDNKNVPLGTIAPVWVKKEGAQKSTKEYGNTPMPTSFDINTAHKRCMVKAIALHGLGLYIYSGEDLPEVDPEVKKKEEEERAAKAQLQKEAAKKVRDIQKEIHQSGDESVRDALNAYVNELQHKANAKVEQMPLELTQKMLMLVEAKVKELQSTQPGEEK